MPILDHFWAELHVPFALSNGPKPFLGTSSPFPAKALKDKNMKPQIASTY